MFHNNFMKNDNFFHIDKISKVFNIFGLLMGVNRVFMLNIKLVYKLAASVHTIFCYSFAIYVISTNLAGEMRDIITIVKFLQYSGTVIIPIILWRRMLKFYVTLEKFDNDMCCKPTTSRRSIAVLASLLIMCLVTCVSMLFAHLEIFLPGNLILIIETHYYGYLLDLIGVRLELLSFFVELWCNVEDSGDRIVNCYSNRRENKQINANSLLDMFTILVEAHKRLTEAIMWQVIVMLITAFLFVLLGFYNALDAIITNDSEVSLTFNIMVMNVFGIEVMSLVVVCVCADHNRALMHKFRRLLAKALRIGQLGKADRNAVRCILALTETENLSFTLLRIIDVSISLPFNFTALVATYLIIMFQFRKINLL